jgi:2-polyprenyl-3-methyl-5-hydroxy-6-metoxy-1,4-benzoquinol methylase
MERTVAEQKAEIVARYGPWTAHNIQLEGDLYTIGNELTYDTLKLRRVTQIVSDITSTPIASLRILDLACLEGQYAVELARQGARVVAIEGREANLEKARLAQRVHHLNNLELHQDDVRNLSEARYGRFDVVLCLGILYHLDVPDVFTFVQQVAEVCQAFAIVDTLVSLTPSESARFDGREYWGQTWVEHHATSTPQERLKKLWPSLDNPTSFKLTRPSLYNLLSHAGFSSVYECHNPPEPGKPQDRVTLLAMRRRRTSLLSAPFVDASPSEAWPEERNAAAPSLRALVGALPLVRRIKRTVGAALPYPWRAKRGTAPPPR